MIKNIEELRNYNISEIRVLINKMQLFELNSLYNNVKLSLSSTNDFINKNYKYKFGMKKDDIQQLERDYNFAINNMSKYEKIFGMILDEIRIRKIDQRFNIKK